MQEPYEKHYPWCWFLNKNYYHLFFYHSKISKNLYTLFVGDPERPKCKQAKLSLSTVQICWEIWSGFSCEGILQTSPMCTLQSLCNTCDFSCNKESIGYSADASNKSKYIHSTSRTFEWEELHCRIIDNCRRGPRNHYEITCKLKFYIFINLICLLEIVFVKMTDKRFDILECANVTKFSF